MINQKQTLVVVLSQVTMILEDILGTKSTWI